MDQNKQQPMLYKTPQFIKPSCPSQLLSQAGTSRKRTKTVCTIGPKTQTPSSIAQLIDQGLSIVRLNFSHGDHQNHQNKLQALNEARKVRPDSHVSVMLDTKGPQIRTGNNKNDENIMLKKGQLLQITTDYSEPCTAQRIACSYQDLPKSTAVGKKILIADGGVSTEVRKIEGNIVTVEVQNDGKIGSRKNMCLPGTVINLPTITEKDEHDIIQFGVKNKVDCIAVSFARYKKDLDDLRKLIIEKDPEHGPYIQLISKIENHQGIQNLDQIIQGSDGIMVARGDLGMEVPLEKVVILQKFITARAINVGKYVITATQMLQSMQSKPRPTRAQVSDITNSVLDLADANMTSGETANGEFPTQSAQYLKKIAQEAQKCCDYKQLFETRKQLVDDKQAVSLVAYSFQLQSHFILIQTDSLKLVNRISSLRPKAYVIVLTDNKYVIGALGANFGVYCFPCAYSKPKQFISNFREEFGYSKQENIKILVAEIQNEKITKFTNVDIS